MSNSNTAYILTNNHNGDCEEIPCNNLMEGYVAFGRHVTKKRAALRNATPTRYGSAYFFVALYRGDRQVAWTARFLRDGGHWDETTVWKNGEEDEIETSSGFYRIDEVHEALGQLAELMGQDDLSAAHRDTYRQTYELLEQEYMTLKVDEILGD